jgi:hypothetical protein
MTQIHSMKSMIVAALALSTVSITPALSDDEGWFWSASRMREWFHSEILDHDMRWGWGHGMMMGRRFTEERLNALKSELAITTAQETSWNEYTKTIKSAAEFMQENRKTMMNGNLPGTLPERLAFHESMMTTRLEEIKKVNAATLSLYNALDAKQKQTADEIIMGMGMM